MTRTGWAGLAVVVLLAGCGSDGSEGAGEDGSKAATSTTAAAVEPTVVPFDGWELLADEPTRVPAPPEGPLEADAVALRDGSVLFYGGRLPYGGGVGEGPGDEPDPPQIFDPADGTWTLVPPGPFEAPLYLPSALAVPGGFVAAGQECTEGVPTPDDGSDVSACTPGTIGLARYDRAAGTWTELTVPEALQTGEADVGTRFDLLTADGDGRLLVEGRGKGGGLWALDADGEAWTEVERRPEMLTQPCGTAGGIVTAAAPETLPFDEPETRDTGLLLASVLQDDGSWEEFPLDQPPRPLLFTTVLCTDTSVLLSSTDAGGYAYEFDVAARTWSEVSAPPVGLDIFAGQAVEGGVVTSTMGSGAERPKLARYRTAGGTWEVSTVDVEGDPQLTLAGEGTVSSDGTFVGRPINGRGDGDEGGPYDDQLVAIPLF